MAALAGMLYESGVMRRLFLNGNRIGCCGATAFGKALHSSSARALRRLGLADNDIGEEGAIALADGADAAKDTLERLCLYGNPVMSASDDFELLGGADAARHRLSQMGNVHLNGLAVVRMTDGRDHYFWTSYAAGKELERDSDGDDGG